LEIRSSQALLPAAAVAGAVLVGTVLGPFWLVDNLLLAFAAVSIIVFCLLKAEPSLWTQGRRPVVRSRIEHYSLVIRTRRPADLKRYASNPFEESLLNMPDIGSISEEDLGRLVASAARGESWSRLESQ